MPASLMQIKSKSVDLIEKQPSGSFKMYKGLVKGEVMLSRNY